MKAWLLALMSSSPVLMTQTFTANTSWTAPGSTVRLETLNGKGAGGTPDSSTPAYDGFMTHYVYRNAVLVNTIGPTYQGHFQGATPNDDTVRTTDPDNFTNFDDFAYHYVSSPDGQQGTTGADATAFGTTFPGGAGGPATSSAYQNVSVTPLASYPIVVPSGGSITITYYQ